MKGFNLSEGDKEALNRALYRYNADSADFEKLIEAGADINSVKYGKSIYSEFIDNSQYDKAIKVSKLKGFKLSKQDQESLSRALHRDLLDFSRVEKIVEAGADINSLRDGKSIFSEFIDKKQYDLAINISKMKGFERSKGDQEALSRALHRDLVNAEKLIEAGADINSVKDEMK